MFLPNQGRLQDRIFAFYMATGPELVQIPSARLFFRGLIAAMTLTDRLYDDHDRAAIDPFAVFEEWFAEARTSEPNDPHALAVATVDATGLPDVRMVLME